MSAELTTVLKSEAVARLGSLPGTKSALDFFDNNPSELESRVNEFEVIIWGLNSLLIFPSTDFSVFINVGNLREMMPPQSAIPSLADIYSERRRRSRTRALVARSLEEIEQNAANGEWQFPRIDPQPGRQASGLLIEGFGLFLEKYYNKPGLARTFVLAFEEVVLTHLPGSRILEDVLEWMIEDREHFSPAIQEMLQEYEPH
ncbi:hypothetical protein HYS29_01190 [Candidatus Microgenomates bacterium]|nr:hypothetical protein [Candidatus Microgenomates bacterium]